MLVFFVSGVYFIPEASFFFFFFFFFTTFLLGLWCSGAGYWGLLKEGERRAEVCGEGERPACFFLGGGWAALGCSARPRQPVVRVR